MSKIKLPLRHINLILVLLTFYCSVFATTKSFIGDYSQDQIEKRLEQLDADVDLKLTPEVKKYLKQYIVSYRQSSETLIGRSLIYFPNMEDKIGERNLPAEIKYLPIVESALKPSARSRVGAVGLWQFMKSTARMYGLTIDKFVDERKDVEKSTDAALEYLADLNERFGDWTLALAAYNCGPGNVNKAMRRSGGTDYWSIRNYLPRETRYYVPKFIAMAYLMNYYADHDLNPRLPDELNVKTRKMRVNESISFSKIAKISGLPVETVEYYNPSYIGRFIPKSKEGNILILPSEAIYAVADDLSLNENIIPDAEQDFLKQTKVAAQIIERKDLIEVAPLDNFHSSLEKLELLYVRSKIEIKSSLLNQNQEDFVELHQQSSALSSRRERRKKTRRQLANRVKATYMSK